MSKLNWNEDAKITVLQKMIFNEVQSQLIDRDMLLILMKFAALCQKIDEDFHLNQASWYRQSNTQWTSWSVSSAVSNSSASVHDSINIDVIHA